MPQTRIKICGITSVEDAISAAQLGADWIGLNMLAGPRKTGWEMAAEIFHKVPTENAPSRPWPHVILCAISGNEYPGAAEWRDAFCRNKSFILQIYGRNYTDLKLSAELDGFSWWMVRHLSSAGSVREIADEYLQLGFAANALLLDAAAPSKAGGTGRSFNWNWIAEARAAGELEGLPPIILAGGLTPDNVAEAIRVARPYAVDVSSGVEVAGKPGIKDPIKMRDFIQAARSA